MGIIGKMAWLLAAVCAASGASGQATLDHLSVKAVAEVEERSMRAGREVVKLAPAVRVVPGERVIYTLEIRNTGSATLPAPSVIYAIPAHMMYEADSASGPGAEILYSADGGRSFDHPQNLVLNSADGQPTVVKPMYYTHIQWKLRNDLKAKSVAFARFRAIVK